MGPGPWPWVHGPGHGQANGQSCPYKSRWVGAQRRMGGRAAPGSSAAGPKSRPGTMVRAHWACAWPEGLGPGMCGPRWPMAARRLPTFQNPDEWGVVWQTLVMRKQMSEEMCIGAICVLIYLLHSVTISRIKILQLSRIFRFS
jgi:hypothetical protein